MVFNYRLSRARRIVENAFGIISNRFCLFHSVINLKDIFNVHIVILTCCYLHNFLRRRSQDSYITPDLCDPHSDQIIELQGIVELQKKKKKTTITGNANNKAKNCRVKFVEYFVNEGRVHWQDESVKKTYFG